MPPSDPVTATALRRDLYRLLDQVIETGIPLEIQRKGHTLRIVAERAPSPLDNLERRTDFLVDDPDSYVHLDWSGEWQP